MAKIHGVAGEWARVKGTVFGLWPLFIGVFACGFSFAVLFLSLVWGVSLLSVSLVYILWSIVKGFRHVERYLKGAIGEERVSKILEGLPDTYHVFNDFTVGRYHVDHVVVGPGGVFSIETKFWSGKVTIEEGALLVDGEPPSRSPLAQTIHEATIVRNALVRSGWSGLVTPVLTFASDSFVAHRAELKGVIVMNSCELKNSFASDRVLLPPAELERLVNLMENNQ